MIRCNVPGLALGFAVALVSAMVAASPAPEGVGDDMGYRLFGEMKKNRPILLQNSRPHVVEVFDEGRGIFVAIAPYSDIEFPCRGKTRKLNLRYRDGFSEAVPFQIVAACGNEIQFVAPAQVAPRRPVAAPPPDAIPADTF